MLAGTLTFATLAILLGAFRVFPAGRRPPSLRQDLAWMVVSAVLMVVLGGIWLATFPLPDSVAITTSDFSEYCRSVTAWVEGRPEHWSPNRAVPSGWLATVFARQLGVPDSLLLNAWLGQCCLGAGLYLWGRSLWSPFAGVAAVLVACTLFPLVALGRMLTFYPVIVGVLTLATGLAAMFWRWPTVRTALLAGTGIGLALLVDLRGLMWALPLLGLSALRVASVAKLRPMLLLAVAVAVPIGISWLLGPYAYPPQTTTLEVLSDLTKGWRGIVDYVPHTPLSAHTQGYIWGRSSIWNIPGTLLSLAEQGQNVPPALRTHPDTVASLQQHLMPLQPALVATTILAGVGLLRHPSRLVFLLGSALPFAVALEGAVAARFAGLRFLGNGAPVLALLGGLGVAVLLFGTPWASSARDRSMGPRGWAALVFVFLVVVGTVPSPFSPLEAWRGNYKNADGGLLTGCPAPTGAPELPSILYSLP